MSAFCNTRSDFHMEKTGSMGSMDTSNEINKLVKFSPKCGTNPVRLGGP